MTMPIPVLHGRAERPSRCPAPQPAQSTKATPSGRPGRSALVASARALVTDLRELVVELGAHGGGPAHHSPSTHLTSSQELKQQEQGNTHQTASRVLDPLPLALPSAQPILSPTSRQSSALDDSIASSKPEGDGSPDEPAGSGRVRHPAAPFCRSSSDSKGGGQKGTKNGGKSRVGVRAKICCTPHFFGGSAL
jgi:hypothetical protein